MQNSQIKILALGLTFAAHVFYFCGEFYMLDYFDRHLIHTIAIYRYLQYQGRINDFIEV